MARPRLYNDDFGSAIEDFGSSGLTGGDQINPGPGYSGPLADEGSGEDVIIPEDFDPNLGRGSEGPRERGGSTGPGGVRRRPAPGPSIPKGPAGGPRPTPPTPPEPTPAPGIPQPGPTPEPNPTPSPTPSEPMPPPPGSPPVPGTARLRGQRLMGTGGGLLGGGLGSPFDPVADEKSFDIETLIKLLGGQ